MKSWVDSSELNKKCLVWGCGCDSGSRKGERETLWNPLSSQAGLIGVLQAMIDPVTKEQRAFLGNTTKVVFQPMNAQIHAYINTHTHKEIMKRVDTHAMG